jgi:hypothetical protein
MDLFSFIGLIILLLICIGILVAVGCAALFFVVIIIGGILTLIMDIIDKCKTLK